MLLAGAWLEGLAGPRLRSYCFTPPVWAGTAGLAEPGAQGVAKGLTLIWQSLTLHSCCTLGKESVNGIVFEMHRESDLNLKKKNSLR